MDTLLYALLRRRLNELSGSTVIPEQQRSNVAVNSNLCFAF